VLTVGSLFSGIGGFDLGLERAGMRVLWQCEIDPYAQRVLAKHWPDVLLLPDIRDVRAGAVPRVDVLCGGFPCQDLSYAGAGAGIDGARSGLWGEYARVVGELRPRYVLVENVAALLARGLGRVLGDLAALGYDAEWDCLPASAFGAPHRRDRIWLVAYPQCGGRAGRPHLERRDDLAWDEAEWREGSGDAARGDSSPRAHPDADTRRLQERREPDGWPERPELPASQRHDADGLRAAVAYADAPPGDAARGTGEALPRPEALERSGRRGGSPWDAWAVEPDVGRVAHGIPARVDRLAALGNALVPQIAEWIGRRIVD
jgi:DNA (cytosine-5)-methyltransferase 1